MKTSKLLLALFAAAGLSVAGAGNAAMTDKSAHDTAYKNAESQYKMDKAQCDTMSGNAKDICK